MTGTPNRREVLALGLGLSLSGLSLGQQPNVREVKPGPNVQDTGRFEPFPEEPNDNFWVLDFRFKDPRLIVADVPARGKKVCWYLWYQVINKTNKPRRFFPVFELVTRDRNTRHRDQFLPTVHEAIREIELQIVEGKGQVTEAVMARSVRQHITNLDIIAIARDAID